jgi:hypothetical protein
VILDGEAVCCDDDGMPSFDRVRYRRYDASVFPYAFDLIELNSDDLRREPLSTYRSGRSPVCPLQAWSGGHGCDLRTIIV